MLASLIVQLARNPPAMQETLVQFLSWEDPLEKGEAYPLQYSDLENSIDCIVHFCFPFHLCYVLRPHDLLFYNWKFVSLNPLHQLHLTLDPPPLWPLYSLYLRFSLFCFLDSTHRRYHMLFILPLFHLT